MTARISSEDGRARPRSAPRLSRTARQRRGRRVDRISVETRDAAAPRRPTSILSARRSDEFMNLLRTLQLYDDKMRIVLNKADQVSNAELLRVIQAASWNLAKTLRTPEVKRTSSRPARSIL